MESRHYVDRRLTSKSWDARVVKWANLNRITRLELNASGIFICNETLTFQLKSVVDARGTFAIRDGTDGAEGCVGAGMQVLDVSGKAAILPGSSDYAFFASKRTQFHAT